VCTHHVIHLETTGYTRWWRLRTNHGLGKINTCGAVLIDFGNNFHEIHENYAAGLGLEGRNYMCFLREKYIFLATRNGVFFFETAPQVQRFLCSV
jgi:hypothetical protein